MQQFLTQPASTEHAEFYPAKVVKVEQDGDKVYLVTQNNVVLCLQVITDHVVRFRYATEGYFHHDFSYALDADYKTGYSDLSVEDKAHTVIVATPKVRIEIDKRNLQATIKDHEGIVLNKDEKGFHWEQHPTYGGNIVKISKHVMPSEAFYGLGDKPTRLNLRDKRFHMWAMDEYGFEETHDPLYKTIPFYMGLHSKKCYGIFFDNTFRSWFDFASERKSVTSFWADGGEMNYYFIVGSDMIKVAERYARLTGKPEMPPMWALGYHQSKWSYYPESMIREIASKMRENRIPCDAIYFDIDYMDGFRCFTWDKDKFPDPKGLVSDLEKDGFKSVAIIDPGIKIDVNYPVFKEAFEKGYFCKRMDGPYLKGKVWPGECYFPDFTNPEVREWWAELFKEMIAEIGVKGIWNDMNEPALFEVENKTFPDDVRHHYDGHHCSHRKAHNVYGMQMSRATYDGVKRFAYPNRPFTITRSTYSGGQRYASTWTGDNIATWEHLRIANIQVQRLSVSGYSFCGTDIGGFIEHPTSQLFIRWIQLGTFHPFMRVHSSGDHGNQEPWSFGPDAMDIVRKYIELRYQLLPYIYTAFYQYSKNGTPIIRPLVFLDHKDDDTHYREDEFMLGDHMLICPVLESSAHGRNVYLPNGYWYDYWTDNKIEGQKEHYIETPLDRIPIYIRPGAVIPYYPVQQYVGEKTLTHLSVDVYYLEGQRESYLFEDRGEGYDYTRGYYNEKIFKLKGSKNTLKIHQHTLGNYVPDYRFYAIRFHGLPFVVKQITCDGETIYDINLNGPLETDIDVHINFEDLVIRG